MMKNSDSILLAAEQITMSLEMVMFTLAATVRDY